MSFCSRRRTAAAAGRRAGVAALAGRNLRALRRNGGVFRTCHQPVFVGLDAAAAESGDAREGFLTDLGERGLHAPLMVVSDGAPGLIGAAERTMGSALRQRCLIHVARINRPSRPGSRRQVGRAVAA